MKISIKYVLTVVGLASCIAGMNSCKQTNNDKYFYNAGRDTIAPKIATSVPLQNSVYAYGQDIHMVGVVTDLESTDKGGKLKSLVLNFSSVDPVDHNIITTYYNRTPVVDGKEGYTFNEKWAVVSGVSTTFCRFLITATDYAGKVTKDSIFLSIQ